MIPVICQPGEFAKFHITRMPSLRFFCCRMLIEHLLISDPTAHHTTVTRTRYSHHYCPGNITYLSTNIFRFMQQNERKTVANSAYINAKRKKMAVTDINPFGDNTVTVGL